MGDDLIIRTQSIVMTEKTQTEMFHDVCLSLGLSPTVAEQVRFQGRDRLASVFPVSKLAVSSIAAAASALSQWIVLFGKAPRVEIDYRLASLWFGWSIKPIGWEMPTPWDAIGGDYQTRDGWIKLHTNAPHHRAAALKVLDCEADRTTIADRVASWHGDSLETAIVAAGGCAAQLRSHEAWLEHPQGKAVGQEPLILWDKPSQLKVSHWQPNRAKPLKGIRVLDLTRVLAGPVATRFLAGYGAEVLRIDPPTWDEPGVVPEVTLGKCCAQLDLTSKIDRDIFESLLRRADIVVHGYRSDALEKLGFGAGMRASIRPGLIDVSLNAYGHSGPWSHRRGFDSLVQFSTGISAHGMAWKGSRAPVSLPVQALDHATGYLLAAAAIRGLIAREKGSGFRRARLSLARVAQLLFDHQTAPFEGDFVPPDESDYDGAIEQTSWGPATRLQSPLTLGDIAMGWDTPATRLGSAPPQWAAG